ncbi:response regulator [Desulfobotulus sp. H1]|uniref:Response regulator n=1 Tax=Desulfobotulus pelophilus TaxID=2823377 RepID=A0ABT3N979_9BACT|nr:response regulator [Desulfobotulus pelophilus]MCW7753990.1 response regulator [Desulfobotulus pelophilus]
MEPIRILVVDDEVDFTEMLCLRLKEVGHLADAVHDGEACMSMLDQKPYDVLVLDIRMPGMDGLQVLRQIKSDHISTEVILLTGHGSTETAVEGMKRGAFDYALKPYEFTELLEKIQEARAVKKEREERIRKAEERSRMDRLEKNIRF